jgi:hypothetical protein
MKLETWKMETWTWRHGNMEIWRYGDMETRRHGEWRNGEMNMETSNGKWKMEAQAIIP